MLPQYKCNTLTALHIVGNLAKHLDILDFEYTLKGGGGRGGSSESFTTLGINTLLLIELEGSESRIRSQHNKSKKRRFERQYESYYQLPLILVHNSLSCPIIFWKHEEEKGRHLLLAGIAKLIYSTLVTFTPSKTCIQHCWYFQK